VSTIMTSATAESLKEETSTIADRVFGQVRQAIVEGEIPAGSKISEPALAARYGISRGPLREAMRRLESTNLVERRPNLGARVITLSNDELLEIYVIREALEGMAARIAAERMSDAAIADLKGLLEQSQARGRARRLADLFPGGRRSRLPLPHRPGQRQPAPHRHPLQRPLSPGTHVSLPVRDEERPGRGCAQGA
jgi:DNA-binding GntR family transcriptional regulator